MDWLHSLLDSSTTPALTAFLLGLLTAISPCPLATNIAAIGFIGKDIESRGTIFRKQSSAAYWGAHWPIPCWARTDNCVERRGQPVWHSEGCCPVRRNASWPRVAGGRSVHAVGATGSRYPLGASKRMERNWQGEAVPVLCCSEFCSPWLSAPQVGCSTSVC